MATHTLPVVAGDKDRSLQEVLHRLTASRAPLGADADPIVTAAQTWPDAIFSRGTLSQRQVAQGGQTLLARAQNAVGARPAFEPGARVGLEVAPGAARVLAD